MSKKSKSFEDQDIDKDDWLGMWKTRNDEELDENIHDTSKNSWNYSQKNSNDQPFTDYPCQNPMFNDVSGSSLTDFMIAHKRNGKHENARSSDDISSSVHSCSHSPTPSLESSGPDIPVSKLDFSVFKE